MSEINENEIKNRLKALANLKARDEVVSDDLKRVKQTLTSRKVEQETIRLNIRRIIFTGKTAKYAAAAAIIIAYSLFFMQQEPPGEMQPEKITPTPRLSSDLTTLATLTFAYRQGGMKMVDEIFDQALMMAEPLPVNSSIHY